MKTKKNCQHSFAPLRKSCYGKLVPVKEAEGILFSKLTYLQLISNFFMQMGKFVKCSRCSKEVSLAQTLFKVMFKYAYQ